MWRRYLKYALLLIIISQTITADNFSPEAAFDVTLNHFIGGRHFNWTAWETEAVLEEAGWRLRGWPAPGDEAEQKAFVLAYLDRQRQIAELTEAVRREYAHLSQTDGVLPAAPPSSLVEMESRLADLRRQQEAATPQVERILSAQVAAVLQAEGFGRGNNIWPPVAFRFADLPTYLIISPRDKIFTYRDAYLQSAMPEKDRAGLENTVEAELDVSALVDNVGGIGSWPTMVIRSASLHSLLDIIAHEWSHTWLLFRPLGMRYDVSRDLQTMNETVASIFGGEVADLVLARYYPELLPPPETVDTTADRGPLTAEQDSSSDPVEEDFNQAMRRIRLRVDELLAAGQVAEAESYMEAERQKLVEKGHFIRRLNQAYFAFHGSYATSPTSVDPIGPWMRQLRAQSDSLEAFMEQAAAMESLEDLLDALE